LGRDMVERFTSICEQQQQSLLMPMLEQWVR
jgi:hypothetical protein